MLEGRNADCSSSAQRIATFVCLPQSTIVVIGTGDDKLHDYCQVYLSADLKGKCINNFGYLVLTLSFHGITAFVCSVLESRTYIHASTTCVL